MTRRPPLRLWSGGVLGCWVLGWWVDGVGGCWQFMLHVKIDFPCSMSRSPFPIAEWGDSGVLGCVDGQEDSTEPRYSLEKSPKRGKHVSCATRPAHFHPPAQHSARTTPLPPVTE